MLILLGVVVVVVGFAVRLNPLFVVVLAAFVTGLLAGLTPVEVLAAFGKAFNENRFVTVAYLVLPMVGVLERAGIQEQARRVMGGFRAASVGPVWESSTLRRGSKMPKRTQPRAERIGRSFPEKLQTKPMPEILVNGWMSMSCG